MLLSDANACVTSANLKFIDIVDPFIILNVDLSSKIFDCGSIDQLPHVRQPLPTPPVLTLDRELLVADVVHCIQFQYLLHGSVRRSRQPTLYSSTFMSELASALYLVKRPRRLDVHEAPSAVLVPFIHQLMHRFVVDLSTFVGSSPPSPPHSCNHHSVHDFRMGQTCP